MAKPPSPTPLPATPALIRRGAAALVTAALVGCGGAPGQPPQAHPGDIIPPQAPPVPDQEAIPPQPAPVEEAPQVAPPPQPAPAQ